MENQITVEAKSLKLVADQMKAIVGNHKQLELNYVSLQYSNGWLRVTAMDYKKHVLRSTLPAFKQAGKPQEFSILVLPQELTALADTDADLIHFVPGENGYIRITAGGVSKSYPTFFKNGVDPENYPELDLESFTLIDSQQFMSVENLVAGIEKAMPARCRSKLAVQGLTGCVITKSGYIESTDGFRLHRSKVEPLSSTQSRPWELITPVDPTKALKAFAKLLGPAKASLSIFQNPDTETAFAVLTSNDGKYALALSDCVLEYTDQDIVSEGRKFESRHKAFQDYFPGDFNGYETLYATKEEWLKIIKKLEKLETNKTVGVTFTGSKIKTANGFDYETNLNCTTSNPEAFRLRFDFLKDAIQAASGDKKAVIALTFTDGDYPVYVYKKSEDAKHVHEYEFIAVIMTMTIR